jgi:hypothetical protein
MDILNIIYFSILAAGFLVSLSIYLEKNAPRYLQLFPPFLALTFCIEMIGYFMRIRKVGNAPMYNFFTTFEFIFYFSVLHAVIKQPMVRKAILMAIWGYPLIALLNICCFQGLNTLHTNTINLGAILIIVFCIVYFYELIKHTAHAKPLRASAFWICCGLLFFYTLTLPIMAAKGLNLIQRPYYRLLMSTPNYLLYTTFTIAFLCRIKYPKRIAAGAG